jgi:5'-phosphate synthase pdxT subunit
LLYGILSHQGDYILHERMLRKLKCRSIQVFTRQDIEKIDALFIPGGESTTLVKFFDRLNLWDFTRKRIQDGLWVFGTCAGIIMLSREIVGSSQKTLGVLDICVERNAHGRQVDSFEEYIKVPVLGEKELKAVFIRAPRIRKTGKEVEVLAELDAEPVAVRSGRIWGTTFHPELTDDVRLHRTFVQAVEGQTSIKPELIEKTSCTRENLYLS